MQIALTYNCKPEEANQSPRQDYYAEWDNPITIQAVRDALGEEHSVIELEADEHVVEELKEARPDIVFNIAEGIDSPSRESQIPVICEMLGIPYTGSDALTLALCLNKARAKEILSFHQIPTPAFQVLSTPRQRLNGVQFPVVVKPLWEGSSMGIKDDSLVFSRDEAYSRVNRILEEYRQPAIVESYLPGREFTAALLGNGDHVRVLPLVEINFDALPSSAHPIYSYEAKWIWDTAEKPLRIFSCPAAVGGDLKDAIEDVCRRAYNTMGCRDWCRVDVRLDGMGAPHILELNPLPGILPNPDENSCFPKAARAAGMSYAEFIREVLSAARERYGL